MNFPYIKNPKWVILLVLLLAIGAVVAFWATQTPVQEREYSGLFVQSVAQKVVS